MAVNLKKLTFMQIPIVTSRTPPVSSTRADFPARNRQFLLFPVPEPPADGQPVDDPDANWGSHPAAHEPGDLKFVDETTFWATF